MEELKQRARELGLWNLFLPHEPPEGLAPRLSNLDYAPLAEIMGRSHIASEACNCAAPDTGNMEVLTLFGTPEQKERWLVPLLEGEIRSAFVMTEPEVASSDATNIELRIERDGDDYVLNGRKWWASGAMRERCKIMIVMGKTDPDGSALQAAVDDPGRAGHRRASTSSATFPCSATSIRRATQRSVFEDVRVPASNLIAKRRRRLPDRPGPARTGADPPLHAHDRRGGAGARADVRAGGLEGRPSVNPLAERANIQDWIAESRIEIDMARLLTLNAAWLMDTVGNKHARTEIAAIKVAAPNVALKVIDRAIQVFGGGGVSDDFPLATMYAHLRTLRLADGPDEVHKRSIARRELRKVSAQTAVPA